VDKLVDEKAGKIVVVDNFFLGKKENLEEAAKRFRKLSIYRKDAGSYGVMRDIISKEKIDVVYNLATKALPYSFVDPLDAYMVNVNIAGCLLELLRKKLYKTLIHFSSSEAYGTGKTVRMAENHPLDPHTPYAAGKAAADMMVFAYHKIFDLDIAIIRPFNTYGPRQNEGSYAAVIPLTIKRILAGEKPVLEGDGNQTRDFTYVDDVAGAAIAVYKNRKTRGKVINIANGKETKIKTIINLVAKHLKYKGKIARKPARIGDVRRHCADIGLAKSLIGFKPKVRLGDGLRRTVDWYRHYLKI
jgi:UDP-glucose 4-epimerase